MVRVGSHCPNDRITLTSDKQTGDFSMAHMLYSSSRGPSWKNSGSRPLLALLAKVTWKNVIAMTLLLGTVLVAGFEVLPVRGMAVPGSWTTLTPRPGVAQEGLGAAA